MNNIIFLRGLTFSVVILLSTACSHVENKEDATVSQNQSTSSIITNLKHLNINENVVANDKNLRKFLEGYEHIKIGTIDKAYNIFTSLQNSQDKKAKEYGEYGLLLITFETDNMLNMQQRIQSIENLENRSSWLNKELRNYNIYYNYNTADFVKAEELLDLIPMSELIKNSFLSAIRSDLYIRINNLNEAEELLEQLEVDSEYSISIEARLLSLTQGNYKTVDYVKSKVTTYPDNEYLRLLYNQYLIQTKQQEAIDNAYMLGMETESSYILAHSIELLFPDATGSKTLERLNTLNDKLNSSSTAKSYIDYYLIKIALPVNDKEMSMNLATANEFNPMNYNLLIQKYYTATDREGQLNALKNLEKIDPYDNYILSELAKFYQTNSMSTELSEVRQRFINSDRFKTKDEIKFMNSL
ncbi:hypothetical protein ACTXMK_09855 [Psychrobacter celer]|uniref:hypothetical protein n=1 Tax=Psychrobacter celer TaxID=306572 RepID=UPI003FD308C3